MDWLTMDNKEHQQCLLYLVVNLTKEKPEAFEVMLPHGSVP